MLMINNEPLDYCRVKKIFDKGFGFLKSLYYKEPVFFHFNNVKDPAAKEKLEKMKRGEVYFYFTSTLYKGRRRVYKLWLDIGDIDKELIPQFSDRIIEEFISGKTNPFEVAYVVKQLRKNDYLSKENFKKIISSQKMIKTPSILKTMLIENETDKLENLEESVTLLENNKLTADEWIESVLSIFNN